MCCWQCWPLYRAYCSKAVVKHLCVPWSQQEGVSLPWFPQLWQSLLAWDLEEAVLQQDTKGQLQTKGIFLLFYTHKLREHSIFLIFLYWFNISSAQKYELSSSGMFFFLLYFYYLVWHWWWRRCELICQSSANRPTWVHREGREDEKTWWALHLELWWPPHTWHGQAHVVYVVAWGRSPRCS